MLKINSIFYQFIVWFGWPADPGKGHLQNVEGPKHHRRRTGSRQVEAQEIYCGASHANNIGLRFKIIHLDWHIFRNFIQCFCWYTQKRWVVFCSNQRRPLQARPRRCMRLWTVRELSLLLWKNRETPSRPMTLLRRYLRLREDRRRYCGGI